MEGLSGKAKSPFRNVFHRFEPELWVITVIQFFTVIGFSICMPFLSLYLYQDRGLSMTVVGTILLAAGLCSAVSQAFGGALSDRFGRRPILLTATFVSIFLYTGLAVLIGIAAPVWAIVVAYIAGRSTLTITRPVISAMVADFTSKERLTEAYGILRIGANIGWAAGPAIGGYLATFLPYGWLFGVPALTCCIVSFIVFFFVRESSSGMGGRVGFRSVLPPAGDRAFLVFTMVSLLLFIVMGQMVSTLSIFAVDRVGFSFAQYSLLLTLNGLIVIFFQYPMTLALRRIAKYRALILGSLLYVFGYLSLGWITQFGWALGAMAIITAGEIIHSPVTLSVIGELSPQDQRGRYMGFFGLSETIGIAMGPLVGGILLDAFPFDLRLVWAPIASIALIAAIGYRWWARRFRL
ncbi:MAG TPA: MFS transporter [Dehalococcoidia bacterium]|nr:MFS transporter [Dehalococcoidia bacterium]